MPRVVVNPPAQFITGSVIRVIYDIITDGNAQQFLVDYMRTIAGDPRPDMPLLTTAVQSAVNAPLQACLTTQSTITTIFTVSLADNTVPTLITSLSVAGTVSGGYCPLWVQATVEKITALRGQHGRGRCQFPAVPTELTNISANPNNLSTTGVTTYNSLMGPLLGTYTLSNGSVFYPVVSTRPKQVSPPVPLLVSRAQLITSFRTRPALGTQLRRVPGRGI